MLSPGKIKSTPQDFVVEEIPAYSPSGEGAHLYIHFTKTNLTTDEAVKKIATALGVNVRNCGVPGMKDKFAVTTQWISVPVMDATMDVRAKELTLEGIVVHEAKRHGNKLKTGHLAGNRFSIAVRGVPADRVDDVVQTLERVGREGMPNAFGAQRFGRAGDNAERARKWLTGSEAGPRDPRQKRFLWSALQSAVFNAVLDARVADATWATPLEGDILRKGRHVLAATEGDAEPERGGLFVCTDVQTDRERAARGEVSPTGPIVGVKMRSPSGRPAEIEREVASKILGEGFDLAATRALGEGTRRGLRLVVEGMRVTREVSQEEASLRVYFVLPKGAYATTVLGAAIRLENAPERHDSTADDTTPESDHS